METLNDRSNEYRLERQKLRKRILAVIGIILAAAAVFFIILLIWNGVRTKTYTGYTEVSSFERTDSNSVQYEYYDGNLLKYSRDGASAINSEGEVLWNGSYEMSTPLVDKCGTYVAIAEQNGKEIYVYNGSDEGTVINTPLPVTMLRVASQGVVAAVLEDTNSNVIALYNTYASSDKLLAEVPSNVSEDGYPVDIAISPDAKSLVTVYVAVSGGDPVSNVCFYNFSEVGQDKNRIVGGKTYADSFAVSAEFVGEDTVCIFLDNGFSLFSNMKQPEESAAQVFEQEITGSVFDNGYVGFIFSGSGEELSHQLMLYNASGDLILDKTLDYDYNYVTMNNGEIIFTSDTGCIILRTNGSEKLNCKFGSPIQYFIKAKGKSSYYMIDDKKISYVKLTEE